MKTLIGICLTLIVFGNFTSTAEARSKPLMGLGPEASAREEDRRRVLRENCLKIGGKLDNTESPVVCEWVRANPRVVFYFKNDDLFADGFYVSERRTIMFVEACSHLGKIVQIRETVFCKVDNAYHHTLKFEEYLKKKRW